MDPVTYQTGSESISQKLLKLVGGFLYVGKTTRFVVIPDSAKKGCWVALQDRLNRPCSGSNIAWKVALYVTVFLPLIALCMNIGLRWYLGISSIEVKGNLQAGSQLERKIPTPLLGKIVSFLSPTDFYRFTQVGSCVGYLKRDEEARLRNIVKVIVQPLQEDGEGRTPLHSFLSSCIAGSHVWNSLMDDLILDWRNLHLFEPRRLEDLTQGHSELAQQLGKLQVPITANELYHFCRYIGNRCLQGAVFSGYRVLEGYQLERSLNRVKIGAERALRKYLTERALGEKITLCSIPWNQGTSRLQFRRFDLPAHWFEQGQTSPMPVVLQEALLEPIRRFRSLQPRRPFIINVSDQFKHRLGESSVLAVQERANQSVPEMVQQYPEAVVPQIP